MQTSTSLNPKTAAEPKPPDPATPFAEKVSFAAALAKPKLRPRFPAIPLPNRQYGYMDGKPKISFTSTELEAGAKAYQFSLIAKFTVGRPSIDVIRQAFQASWDIKGRATLCEIWDARHLLVILDSEGDMIAAMTSPMRKVQHAMFRLFRYSTDYNPRQESSVAVKWLRLPGLPPPLFHRNYIGAIVNSFADFLDIDDRTKACATMRYARACAKIDVTHPIPGKVWIDLPDGKGYWQEIILEGNLAYCSHCKIHGHELAQCRKKKPAEQKMQQGQVTIMKRPTQSTSKQPTQELTEVTHKKGSTSVTSHVGYGPDMLYKSTSLVTSEVELGERLERKEIEPAQDINSETTDKVSKPAQEISQQKEVGKQTVSNNIIIMEPLEPTQSKSNAGAAQADATITRGNSTADLVENEPSTLSVQLATSRSCSNPPISKEGVTTNIKGILKNSKTVHPSKNANTSSKEHKSETPPNLTQ